MPDGHADLQADVERALGELHRVMERLLGEGGCPWDREQTPDSLRPFLLEETYELLDALDRGDAAGIREELGDVLYQVYFHAALFRRRGDFGLAGVARGMADKLVRRHPHVFGDAEATSAGQVRRSWDQLKKAERESATGAAASVLDGVPVALPALSRAQKIQQRAARTGFDWPGIEGVLAKLEEERREVEEALESGDPAEVTAEIGDLLFTVVNLARFAGVGAEEALRGANARFDLRFRRVEALARERGSSPDALDLEALEELWQQAKRDVEAR
jgi:MazG family protein